MDGRRRFSPAQLALGALALVGTVSAAGFSGLNPERLVTSAFDRAFEIEGQRARLASATTAERRAYDGLAGSESFWLRRGDPDVLRTVAVGQPIFLPAAAGREFRRLIVTDIREVPALQGPIDETHIDTRGGADSPSYLIVGRDVADPAGGEFHIMYRNGALSIVKVPGPQSL